MKHVRLTFAVCTIVTALSLRCLAQRASGPTSSSHAQALALRGDVDGAHDPSMIHAGHTWYVFTTGRAADGGQLGLRCSDDLTTWRNCGHVLDQVPAWIHERSPLTKDLWAPDISFEHGEYRLYYAYSVFGKNTSGIALATNTTLDASSKDYKWQDKGLVLESVATDNFNAIDPNYIEDSNHRAWLDFGSFWSGIKMRQIDPATGKLLTSDARLYSLASRAQDGSAAVTTAPLPPDSQAVEAPFLFSHGGYYYLFVSFDLCCRGKASTYRTMVGRARTITGPYLDKSGKPMLQGGGSELLHGNTRWLGPGGESVVPGADGGPDLLVYHAYDGQSGKPALQLSTIEWNDGWPEVKLAE